MPNPPPCPFCSPNPANLIHQDHLTLALRDNHPGHALIIPRRHITTIADATPEERLALFALLDRVRQHLDLAHQVDIAVAFTMVNGLKLIYERLKDLLERGGALRFLTGDYLDVTEPGALRRLLDLTDLTDPNRPDPELRVFHAADQSFHPKACIFRQEDGCGTAIVGSSNLSATALGPGVEWNYRVITSRGR